MTSAEIRRSFLDFFREKEHTIVPSSSLLPDAPNLLFTLRRLFQEGGERVGVGTGGPPLEISRLAHLRHGLPARPGRSRELRPGGA